MNCRPTLPLLGLLVSTFSLPAEDPPERVAYTPTSRWIEEWSPVYFPDQVESVSTWWGGANASGHWFGYRPLLRDQGLQFTASYANDTLANPVGGFAQEIAYAHNVGFQLDIDLERTIGIDDAHFVISGLQRTGRNLTADAIGNQFTVAQIYGNQTAVFYGLWLDQNLFDGKIRFKLGRFATGDDFYSSPLYWLYVNNAIDGNPQSIPVNAALPSYPNATWAAMLRANPTEEHYAMAGAYQVTPRLGDPAYHGLDFSIRPDDAIGLIAEFGWTPTFFEDKSLPAPSGKSKAIPGKRLREPLEPQVDSGESGYPGHYKFGIYWTSQIYVNFNGQSTSPNAYGFYWLADQMLYREKEGSDQGLTAWTALTFSPQQELAKMPFYAGAGLVYKGLIPNRDKDFAVFGAYFGQFSRDFVRGERSRQNFVPSSELVFEWGYRIQVNGWFYIQPDLQWVINPGASITGPQAPGPTSRGPRAGGIPNALVIGGQMGVNF